MRRFVQTIITIVLFFLGILGGLVVIHELGHFVIARLAKVRVLEFGIGFPPRAKVLARRARRCTRSTGCRSAASSSSRARTATDPDDPRSFARASAAGPGADHLSPAWS